MGVDYGAKALWGFPLKSRKINETVTKYDENTGKPYSKTKFSHTEWYLPKTDLVYDTNALYENPGETDGLDLINVPDYGGDEEWYLGKEIEDLEVGQTVEIDLVVPDNIQAFADKYSLKPRIYFANYCY